MYRKIQYDVIHYIILWLIYVRQIDVTFYQSCNIICKKIFVQENSDRCKCQWLICFLCVQVDESRTCVKFRADRWYPVANGTIQHRFRVYDYYEPGEWLLESVTIQCFLFGGLFLFNIFWQNCFFYLFYCLLKQLYCANILNIQ